MNMALRMFPRRHRYDNVVIADARVQDRREDYEARRDAEESERLRQQYIAQSKRFAAWKYEQTEMLDGRQNEIDGSLCVAEF